MQICQNPAVFVIEGVISQNTAPPHPVSKALSIYSLNNLLFYSEKMSLKTTHPSAKRRNKDRSKAAMQVVLQVEQVTAPPSGLECVLQPTTSANPDTFSCVCDVSCRL